MRIRLSALLVLAIGCTLWPFASAAAACETELEFEPALERADAVFVARVTATSDGGATAEAKVQGVWKGPDLPQTVTLLGGDTASGNTRIHEVGRSYLVVAAWSRSGFNDNRCTATRPYNGLATEIPAHLREAVGADDARLPLAAETEAVGSEGTTSRIFIVILVVFGLALVGAYLYDKLTRSEPVARAVEPQPVTPEPKKPQPSRQKRHLAGWTSGRFSRSGKRKVDRLKSKR
jgi:hypothetical protein